MFFTPWLHPLSHNRRTSGRSSAQRLLRQNRRWPARPCLEPLEDRLVLSSSPNQLLVGQLYRDLLHREADGGGLAFWSGRLDQNAATDQVARGIEGSPEYHTRVVQDLYNLLLKRSADPAGLQAGVNFLDQGGTADQLEVLLVGADEYFTRRSGGTEDGCLQANYADMLHRPLDAGGAQFWSQAAAQGTSRTAICAAILDSPEGQSAEVQSLFGQFLRRSGDSSGLTSFTAALRQGAPREQLVAALVGSAEYAARFPKVLATTTISGVVQDPNGHPVAGVPIQVGGLQAVTRADGSFSLTVPNAGYTDAFNIPVPQGDPAFDPTGTGTQVIPLARDRFDPLTGTDAANPRRVPNVVSSFIDASMVYGSDPQRAAALRTFDGTGKLKTSAGGLLPFNNAASFPNGPVNNDNNGVMSPTQLFVTGDVRANENVGLATLHTLFVREHNRLAGQIKQANPGLGDEDIYQQARRIVAAEIQHITYSEYLPLLLGPDGLNPYASYDPAVDPTPGVLFTTAAFRFAHSQTPQTMVLLGADGNPLAGGSLSLLDGSFNSQPVIQSGIDPVLRTLAAQAVPPVAAFEVDGARNLLFGPPGAGGLDLVSVDIQRGRDLGLPSYNQARKDFGLAPVTGFAQITANSAVQVELQAAYGSVDKIDALVGMVAEDHVSGAMVGPLLFNVIKDQFQRLRDGDRFWYEHGQFTPSELVQIRGTTLADIIERNTGVTNLQANVFTTKTAPAGPAPAGQAAASVPAEYRSFDGSGNNPFRLKLGSTGTDIRVDSSVSYGDGVSTPNGADRPGPRMVSNTVFSHVDLTPDPSGANLMNFFWGQFLTHDIDLTPSGLPGTLRADGEVLNGTPAFAFTAKKLSDLLGHPVQSGVNNVIAQPITLKTA